MEEKRDLFDNRPYMWGWEKMIDEGGKQPSRFTYVATGEAAVVVPLRYRIDGTLCLQLLRERRPAIEKDVIKTIGGYCNGKSFKECARLRAEAEYGIITSEEDLVEFGEMTGYDTIKTPIKLFYTLHWRIAGEDMIENLTLTGGRYILCTLLEAVDLVLNREVGDECTATAILLLFLLKKRDLLPRH